MSNKKHFLIDQTAFLIGSHISSAAALNGKR